MYLVLKDYLVYSVLCFPLEIIVSLLVSYFAFIGSINIRRSKDGLIGLLVSLEFVIIAIKIIGLISTVILSSSNIMLHSGDKYYFSQLLGISPIQLSNLSIVIIMGVLCTTTFLFSLLVRIISHDKDYQRYSYLEVFRLDLKNDIFDKYSIVLTVSAILTTWSLISFNAI